MELPKVFRKRILFAAGFGKVGLSGIVRLEAFL
jgi:hypothetical protein